MIKEKIKESKYVILLDFWNVSFSDVESINKIVQSAIGLVDRMQIESDYTGWGTGGEYREKNLDVDMMSIQIYFNDEESFTKAIGIVDQNREFEAWPQQRPETKSYKFVGELK